MSEKTLLSKLNNPFIVNMYFTFQDFSNLYLVMDLLTGGDLRYHLAKKKRFSERETKFFIANMLLALEYIHSKNIIHRDIKPENLVLELNGYLRITDFGVAKINEKDNSSETSGTPGYMAPEVILVQNHSFPSDFFALGVIGYEFMLGFRPYLGGSRKEIKELIIYKQARLNECDIPYSWSLESGDFINKLLKRKPTKRLGYHGVKEIKNHIWMRDINWDLLKKKEINAPFIPNPNRENFDKEYCERVEDIGETTIERYQEYAESDLFLEVFEGYTYINIEYLKSKHNENTEKEQKKNKDNKDNKEKKRKESSSSSRIKKNYSTNLTIQKKSISISQENNFNYSNRENRLKINLRKRNKDKNVSNNIMNSIKKKQTIDIDNKKEVLKRMSVNDNIKTNKNYLSNAYSNNKKEKDIQLNYDKEQLKKKAVKISSKMKELKNSNEMNINANTNKKSVSKKFILNKSNSMKILNSLNKENMNNNILGNNIFKKKNSTKKEYKNVVRNSGLKNKNNKNNEGKHNENKKMILVEKKKSYQKYNINLNIKDKLIKKDETIHTYDIIKKNKKQNIKGNNSQRNNYKENHIIINEEKDNKNNNAKLIIKVNSHRDKRKEEIKNKKKEGQSKFNIEIEKAENIDNKNKKEIINKEVNNEIDRSKLNEDSINNANDQSKENNQNNFESNDKNDIIGPRSKIMCWIKNSLPISDNMADGKFNTIDDNNISNNNNNVNNNNNNMNENGNIVNNINILYKSENIKSENEKEENNKKEINTIININDNNDEYYKMENEKNKNYDKDSIYNNINSSRNINELIQESHIFNKKNYKTITIDTNNKFKTKKVLKKKYYKSLNNTNKKFLLPKNSSCPNIYFDKHNLISKSIKSKSPKNTFLVFNTININLGNTSKNYKRNRTPKIQVMKKINSSFKNIYLSNDILFEPIKYNNYLNKKNYEKNKGTSTIKKKLNIVKNNKLKNFKRNNIDNNLCSENTKSMPSFNK